MSVRKLSGTKELSCLAYALEINLRLGNLSPIRCLSTVTQLTQRAPSTRQFAKITMSDISVSNRSDVEQNPQFTMRSFAADEAAVPPRCTG